MPEKIRFDSMRAVRLWVAVRINEELRVANEVSDIPCSKILDRYENLKDSVDKLILRVIVLKNCSAP